MDRFSKESFGYNFGSVGMQALLSNKLLENIQHEKCVYFSAEKCELLKIDSYGNDGLLLNGDKIKSVKTVKYLGDVFNDKGDNSELCKDTYDRVKGTITELFALSKGIKFGIKQFESLLSLYKTVFLPRLINNCDAWSGLTIKGLKALKSSQLSYLRGYCPGQWKSFIANE